MRRLLLPAIAVGVLAFSLLQAGSRADAFPTAVSLGSETEISRPASVRASTNIVRLGKPLRGVVLAWNGERGIRVPGAHIGTGEHTLDADDWGRFFIPASIRTNQLNIVAAGYEIVRKQTTADYIVIYLRPLDARAIYIPYDQLRRQLVLDWALDLARQGNVSAMVIDVKNEDGGVLPLVANQTARDFDFVRGTGTDLRAFFNELGDLGIYRIARVVTFLDSRLATASPSDAILTSDGRIFRDPLGLAWTNPFRELPRKHNIEIGVNAAKFFDEVQYDYVRLPTQSGVALRSRTTSDERSGAIANFAKEAAEALHAVGAALSFDTFGQTTVLTHDDGIGQVLEDLAPFLDYFSPMVYPSTWSTGWFGLTYPPADPFRVVRDSVGSSVQRLESFPNVVVRPWLQDFHDYQAQKLSYGTDRVLAQIQGSDQAGGQGFMLWDPSLNYHFAVFE